MEDLKFQSVADFCESKWKDRSEKVIEIADSVCNNDFLFDMPWDMERTEENVHFDNKINWYHKLNGDNEFLYQINRHGFLIHLGQAYCFTYNVKYAKKFCELLEDWIDSVPCDLGTFSPWRSLEVGIRVDNWIKAIPYIEDTVYYTPELKQKVEDSIKCHIEVLIKEHKSFQKGSNWGIIQDNGLFTAASYFDDYETMQIAIDRLVEETNLQVMADGMHWEQSCGYHNAVLVCLLNVYQVALKKDFELPKCLTDKIFKMANVNLMWIKPNGQQPLFGDSDDNDVRDVLCRAAVLFDSPQFKALAYDFLDYDSAWLLGTPGIQKFDELDSEIPDFLNANLNDSGSFIIRSDWSKNANWLCMHNGYTGGGHAHADKLHFDLMIGGKDVLVDSGRYTYMNNSKRKFVKEPQGHNTSVVGKRKFLKMTSAWNTINPALSVQYPAFDDKYCTLIGGGHLGYLKSSSTYVERQILHIKPDIFIVIDKFNSPLYHFYHQYFHFAPNGKVDVNSNRNIVSFSDGDVKANVHFVSKGVKIYKMKSYYSSNYNAVCENKAVKTRFSGIGNRTAITVIYGSKNSEFKPFKVRQVSVKSAKGVVQPLSKAEGIVIKTPEHEYTIYLAHEEIMKTVTCNLKTVTGRIMVFKDDELIFRKW